MMINGVSESFVNALGWTLVHSLWQCGTIAISLFFYLRKNPYISGRVCALGCRLSLVACLLMSMITFYKLSVFDYPINATVSKNEEFAFASFLVSSTGLSVTYMYYTSIFWITGCCLFACINIRDFLHCCQLRRQHTTDAPSELILLLQSWVQYLDISKPVQLRLSKIVSGPCVIGHFRPIILLPFDAITGSCTLQLSKEHIELILLHELTHIKHCDYLFNLFQSLMKVLYFFNPGVLLISRQLDVAREYACDDKVVQCTQKTTQYAHALKEVAIMKKTNKSGLLLPAVNNRFQLLRRIQRLSIAPTLSYKFSNFFSPALSVVTLIMMVFGLSQLGVSQANAKDSIRGVDASQMANDHLPIEYSPAHYPVKALDNKVEGYCVVEYNVNVLGYVENPKIKSCDKEGYFEEVSLAAALTFKYAPLVINSEVVRVEGVKNKFVFKLN